MPRQLAFGTFRMLPDQRALHADGRDVHLRSRPFDILLALLERRDRTVSKDELLEIVWQGRVVEEGNLSVHIAGLRKLLGDGMIATLPGRGYRFVAPVEESLIERAAGPDRERGAATTPAPSRAPSSELAMPQTPGNLPLPLSRLIGRDEDVARVASLLHEFRLVTVIGAGGIGKTRVALAAAAAARATSPANPDVADFSGGAWLVDLGPITDPALLGATLASVLGIAVRGDDAVRGMCLLLADKRALLVMDGCEHLLEQAALVAEAILQACPNVAILATSQEPLRAEGEMLHRLAPLPVAPAAVDPTADSLQDYAAAELFLERARAIDRAFAPTDEQARTIMAICRQLDGLPLAIQLAASRLTTFALDDLAGRLADRFGFLTGGRRTALPRQQTLRATLDWSYGLLSQFERAVLRRLAIFAGGFSPEAAGAIAADTPETTDEAIATVGDLVAKSLVTMERAGPVTRYRLLDTTRAYALQKLVDAGETPLIAQRNALFYRDLLDRAQLEWVPQSAREWLNIYRGEIDNVRAGLDWAFSPDGDAAIGVSLAASSVRLMFELALIVECRRRTERALAAIGSGVAADARTEMRLRAALAAALVYVRGPSAESIAAWESVLEIAARVDDAEHETRALWGLWNDNIYSGKPRIALGHSQRFAETALRRDDYSKQLLSYRLNAISHHYLGEHTEARREIEFLLERYDHAVHRWSTLGSQVDHRIVGRATLARILWLQGSPDEAVAMTTGAVEDAIAYGHSMSLLYVLVEAALPLSLIVGDLGAARRYLDLLTSHAAQGFVIWQVCGHCFEAALLIRSGEVAVGATRMRAALDRLFETAFASPLTWFLGMLALALGALGEIADALVTVEEAIARCETNGEHWCTAELLRVKGELTSQHGDEIAAETCLVEAAARARDQGAMSWELRALTSLAALRKRQGRMAEGYAALEPVYRRFTEGFTTADLVAAKTALDECRAVSAPTADPSGAALAADSHSRGVRGN